jgi:hypothetical protein
MGPRVESLVTGGGSYRIGVTGGEILVTMGGSFSDWSGSYRLGG